jgi:hypothetical protein
MLQSFLHAPDNAPRTAFHIDRFSMPDVPELTDITWEPADMKQTLSFKAAGHDVELFVLRLSDQHHSIMVRANRQHDQRSFSFDLQLFQTATGFSMSADANVRLQPLLPMLNSMGVLPEQLTSLDATLAGPLTVEIVDEHAQPVHVTSQLTPRSQISLAYQLQEGRELKIQASVLEPINITLEYPSLDWTATTPGIELTASSDSITAVPISIEDLACKSGIHCSLITTIDANNVQFRNWSFSRVNFKTALTVRMEELTHIELPASAQLTVAGASYATYPVDDVSVVSFSGASVTVGEDQWNASAEEIQLQIDGLHIEENFTASFPLILADSRILDDGETISSHLRINAAETTLLYNNLSLQPPDIDGALELNSNMLDASLTLSDVDGGINANFNVQHNLADGTGSLRTASAILDFDLRPLSSLTRKWPNKWDAVSGKLSVDATVNWKSDVDDLAYDGRLELSAAGVAGNYNDLVFAGLDIDVTAGFDSESGYALAPTSVALALFDIGLPLEDLAANITFDPVERVFHVDEFSMNALGGSIEALPFSYDFSDEVNSISLDASSLQLETMIALADFDRISLSGSVSGLLPLLIGVDGVSMQGGRLQSDLPGGVIRYRAPEVDGALEDDNSQIGIVTRALSNFQYESLTADADYSVEGDLKLQMRMEGLNPDMDPYQPVILNLGVENNVPQLLRSLQASRSIADILQKRAEQ